MQRQIQINTFSFPWKYRPKGSTDVLCKLPLICSIDKMSFNNKNDNNNNNNQNQKTNKQTKNHTHTHTTTKKKPTDLDTRDPFVSSTNRPASTTELGPSDRSPETTRQPWLSPLPRASPRVAACGPPSKSADHSPPVLKAREDSCKQKAGISENTIIYKHKDIFVHFHWDNQNQRNDPECLWIRWVVHDKRVTLTRVLATGQEEHNKPESSAAKLYCLHLQEQECKRARARAREQARERMAKPRPF